METPRQFYQIRDLVLLPELNPRAQLCEETIARYMESFDALPPVSIQEGTGVLVDGFHRVEAATRLGAEAIPVRMLDIPDEELHLYAGLGNCGHGRALSRTERNRFIVRLVEQYGWPPDRVAKSIGVSASTVALALREHQYNQALSGRLGEDVQVINSSHVQALYRVGAEQRAQLLDAVASKVDEEGRPRPLTGAELKSLVERMEDPRTPTDDLQRLMADPLARPDPPSRRAARGSLASNSDRETLSEEEKSPPAQPNSAADPLREQLLLRALAPSGESIDTDGLSLDSDELRLSWSEDGPERRPEGRNAFGPGRHVGTAAEADPCSVSEVSHDTLPAASWEASVALLEREEDPRPAALVLKEAERLLSDLCASVEDAELWDQIRSARDLVREAAALVG